MSQYEFTGFQQIAVNASGDSYWFIGTFGAGGVQDGAGLYVEPLPNRPTWDQAGWCWVFMVFNNTSQNHMVQQYPVFFGFNCGDTFPEQYRGSIVFLRFVPVPWLTTYDLYGYRMERVI